MDRLAGSFRQGEHPGSGRANGWSAKYSNDILEQAEPSKIIGIGIGIKEFSDVGNVVVGIGNAFKVGKAAWGEGAGHDGGGAKAAWQNAIKDMGMALSSV